MTVDPLQPTSPEAQGISSQAILDFVNAAEAEIDALHSFILVRHGHRVAQGWWAPYEPDLPHMLFSLSKSFTSTAVGLAVTEGLLTVDDPVIGFFPDDLPEEVSDNLAAMQVRHLLAMSTGHGEDTTGHMRAAPDGNWAKAFLARPVDYEPGTHFLYNTGASYMLSAIVQKLTGQTVLDYLTPRIFEPLGIEGATWDSCPRGINFGGFGLNVKTEDIARVGQLYLQKGTWQGKQLLPSAWVDEATAPHTDNAPHDNADWEQGYGYQFWRCRHNAYRGDGAFGQYCIVMPDQDAVMAITSGVPDMQAVLDLIWEKLLPAMKPEPLPEADAAYRALQTKLAHLALSPLISSLKAEQAAQAGKLAGEVSGKIYVFDVDAQRATMDRLQPSSEARLFKSVTLALGDEIGTVTVTDGRGPQVLDFGMGYWRKGITMLGNDHLEPVATSGAWLDEKTLALKLCLYETPFCPTLTFVLDGDELRYQFVPNVSFGSADTPELVARTTTVGG